MMFLFAWLCENECYVRNNDNIAVNELYWFDSIQMEGSLCIDFPGIYRTKTFDIFVLGGKSILTVLIKIQKYDHLLVPDSKIE